MTKSMAAYDESGTALHYLHALPERARTVAQEAFLHAADIDRDDGVPAQDIRALFEAGLLEAPVHGLGTSAEAADLTFRVLRTIGYGSLPLGRLYEGHVNALKLILTYGTAEQIAQAGEDVRSGALFGVWNTEGRDGVKLVEDTVWRLEGAKTFASGAGIVKRPLITAKTQGGAVLMVLPRLDGKPRADMSAWQPHGMRASASGRYDFSDLVVTPDDVIGADGDYLRQPIFSGGAWRFSAVQLGGIERLFDLARHHLRVIGRDQDPHQRARIGTAAMSLRAAALSIADAGRHAEHSARPDALQTIATVGLTRLQVERCGLDVLEIAQRSVGLAGFMRTHPMERQMRDLATYLRQPAPDKTLDEAAAFVLGSDATASDLWTRS